MQFLLPHENVPLEGITKDLQQATSGMTSILAEVSLKVPKFEINFETDLSEILEELGMESAFNPITANFSSVSNIPLFVSMAKQKAAITVNEKGSEAAAVTILGMEAAADLQEPQKKDFHLNRPFLFLIKELSTDAIFFMGEVTEL
jgi:serpin B